MEKNNRKETDMQDILFNKNNIIWTVSETGAEAKAKALLI